MRARMAYLYLGIALAAGTAAAQQTGKSPTAGDVYCSGIVTTEQVPQDTYLISGEQSNHKVTFAPGDLVYINKGSAQGVKVGDEFLVSRAVKELLEYKWSGWQPMLLRAMGQTYADLGRVRVIHVQPDVSIAEITLSCDYMQRGDILQPAMQRPVPLFKQAAKFDRFAPANSGKAAMVVTTKNFGHLTGTYSTVYVNLGSAQGVKVGDYFRIFRYQGIRTESAYQTSGMAYKVYGFGSSPVSYKWDNLPREILGEGIVLRVSPNASSVLITLSLREIFVGDYVEVE